MFYSYGFCGCGLYYVSGAGSRSSEHDALYYTAIGDGSSLRMVLCTVYGCGLPVVRVPGFGWYRLVCDGVFRSLDLC